MGEARAIGARIGGTMLASNPAGRVVHDRAFDGLGGHQAETVPTRQEAARQVNTLSVFDNLASVEADWRLFEQHADCTVFQSFAWLSAWVTHVGPHHALTPAVVIGRGVNGAILFIMPLAIETGGPARRLTWLGSDLCDYNAPLLAPDFRTRVGNEGFARLWRQVIDLLRSDSRFRPDAIVLEKMPETIGSQPNPFAALAVTLNPSGAYLVHLEGDWESFYTAKRSSATRRRDRTKLKRLSDIGEVRYVNPESSSAISETLTTLFTQKARSFARMGVGNLFARPGYPEFYCGLALNPATRNLVHVSRLEVGEQAAAANFGLIFGDRYHHILASYDDGAVAKFGPGAAHLRDLMRHAIGNGCSEFDFTIGDEPYKRDWADTEIRLYDYRAAISLRGAMVTLPSAVISCVKRFIKQTPFLFAMASRLRAKLGKTAPQPPAEDDSSA